jgi:glycosyltransferase involved in cell wall biosynthesis
MKRVYLKIRSRGLPYHSLYEEIIRYPPKGYEIIVEKPRITKTHPAFLFDRKLLSSPLLVKDLWYNVKPLLYVGTQKLTGAKYRHNCDLTYASQQVIFSKEPWVVDFEFADALTGYGNIRMCRRVIQKALASRFCKKVMPWSEWAKKTLFSSLESSAFKEKVETVHLAVRQKHFSRRKRKNGLRLLFVGSANPSNIFNFELKGGYEVLEAFGRLSQKYQGIELVVRSYVPPDVWKKCSDFKNIKVIKSILTRDELANLYTSSDIFIFPSHANLGMAILDAMSYELPVIALGVYDVPEAITDMKTGVLIKPSKQVPYYTWNGGHNYLDKRFLTEVRRTRHWLIHQLVEKTSLLIEDDSLRQNIAREARHEVEQGTFSIRQRNQKLAKIFGEATRR